MLERRTAVQQITWGVALRIKRLNCLSQQSQARREQLQESQRQR